MVLRTRYRAPASRSDEVVRSMRIVLAMWDELRDKGVPFRFVMRGTSMWPAVPEGSVLEVVPCRTSALCAGDMVTFRRAGTIVTHRVVRLVANGVLAWGDAVIVGDGVIAEADVLGRARVIERGRLVAGVRTGLTALRRVAAAGLRLAHSSRPVG